MLHLPLFGFPRCDFRVIVADTREISLPRRALKTEQARDYIKIELFFEMRDCLLKLIRFFFNYILENIDRIVLFHAF